MKKKFVSKFNIVINCKKRKHGISAKSFFVAEKTEDLVFLQDCATDFVCAIAVQSYDSMLTFVTQGKNKLVTFQDYDNLLKEIKKKIIQEIDNNFSPNKSFSFGLWFKSSDRIKEFYATDMIMAMVKAYLFIKMHPFE